MFKPGQLVKVLNNELNYEIGLILKQEGKFYNDVKAYYILIGDEVSPYREYEIELLKEDNEV